MGACFSVALGHPLWDIRASGPLVPFAVLLLDYQVSINLSYVVTLQHKSVPFPPSSYDVVSFPSWCDIILILVDAFKRLSFV